MATLHDYTEQNRHAWNEIAETRHALLPSAQFYAQGGSTLDPRVCRAVGAVRGLKLLHLQCATGEDTLSWATLGAQATGVDISEVQIGLGRRKAVQSGLPVAFVAADVYRLPDSLQQAQFDVVYMGHGTLVWLPDLERWARVVYQALRPGGRLALFEEHPLAGCVGPSDAGLKVECNYFGRSRPDRAHGWRHFTMGQSGPASSAGFNWPLGDIITAIAEVGLGVRRFEEFPGATEWRFGPHIEDACRLPGDYLLIAEKPRK